MLFRFTLHAALSTAGATAGATAVATNIEEGKTKIPTLDKQDRGSRSSDYHSSSQFSSSSTSSSDNHNVSATKENGNFHDEFQFLPKNVAEEKKNAAFRDPFVPQKLREKYRNAHSNKNIQNLLNNTAEDDGDSAFLNRNNPPTEILLKNPPPFRGTKDESTSIVDEEIFDASNELGVLDSAKIQNHNIEEQQRDLADEMDLSDCDGDYPLVSKNLNFRALVKRCLYYKDNCPFNATLPLKCWDTSQVTDMSYAFYQLRQFNEPLGSWETTRVTDMSDMFGFAESFDQPLNFQTGNVIDMSDMFWGAKSFNQPVNFQTDSVVNMDYMFLDAVKFNQPLNFKTDKVVNMKYMFAFAESFDHPLSSWQTAQTTDMSRMFFYASSFNQPLGSWDVTSVTNMSSMFQGATSFDQNVDYWQTTQVTDMTYMFNRASSFNQCLSTWAYKNPTTLTGPFIFNGTGCPVQGIPDVISGPWCQSADDECLPSSSIEYTTSSANSNSPISATSGHGLLSAILFGALLTPDIIPSFFF